MAHACMLNIIPENFVVHRSVPTHGITQLGLRSHPTESSTLEALTTKFYSLGLTNRFSPLRRSFPFVLATLLRHLYPRLGAHMGDSQIVGAWTCLERELHISMLELKAVILALTGLQYYRAIMG